MKNKVSSKVILAISSFFIAASCLVVSSYAWYSLGQTLAIDNYEFTMSSAGDLSIGLKINSAVLAEKYNLNIGDIYFPKNGNVNDELLKEFNQYDDHTRLFSVTSSYQDQWLNDDSVSPEDKKPVLYKVPTLFNIHGTDKVKESEINHYFYQMELYVKANKPMYIYVDNTTSVYPDLEKNKKEALINADKGVDEAYLNRICDSLRISFYTESNYFIYEPSPDFVDNQIIPTRMFGKLDLYNTDGYYDYKDGKEILFGEYENDERVVYDESGRENHDELPLVSNGLLANSKEEVLPVDIEKSIENGVDGKYQKTYSLNQISAKNEDTERKFSLFTSGGEGEYNSLPAYQKVIVTVWSEGWDKDSIVYPSSSHFNMKLVFGGKALR